MTIIFETDGVQLSGNDASIPNAANSTSVTFSKIYNNPVVIVYSATTNGGQDIDTRVANLTGSGCDLFTHEPDRQGHNDEFLYYAVAEEGVHETPEGHRIEAGVHQTDSSHEDGESFNGNSVSFVNDWASTPVLFSTPNTHNNEDWATVGVENVGSTGFDIAQQRGGSGSTVNDVSVEELGWIAIENVGAGTLDGKSFEVGTTTGTSASWSSFSSQPDVIVDSQTRNGTSSGWMRGNGQGGSGSHGWYFESSGSSQTSGYFAIEADSVVNGIDAVSDRSGTFEFRSPNENYSTGGYDSLDGSNNPKGSGGTFSGVRETVGSVYETPEVKPTSVGELTGTAATTLTSSASVAQATGTEISGTVATMQNAVVNTENTITTTESGLGGTTASVDAILDGALTFTRTATGNGSTVSVGEVETASTIAEGSTVNTNALSGSTVEYGSANTFGGATTATVGGGIQNSSTETVTSPTYTTTSGGTVTDAQSTSQTASGYTTTTPSASPTELHSGRKVIAEVYPERNKEDFRGEWNGIVEYHEFDYLRGVRSYGEYYSQRVRGTLFAPESGTYYFWIAGDNNVSFWLDGSRVLDLNSWTGYNEWDKYPDDQKSSGITLEAGKEYYFEAYMYERGGGDRLQVGWRKPSDGDGSLPVGMVPADHLEPVGVKLREATVDSSSLGGRIEEAMSNPSLAGGGTSVVGVSTPSSGFGQPSTGTPQTATDGFSEVAYSESDVKESRSSLRAISSVANSDVTPTTPTVDSSTTSGGVEYALINPEYASVYSNALSGSTNPSIDPSPTGVTTQIEAATSVVTSTSLTLEAGSKSVGVSGGVTATSSVVSSSPGISETTGLSSATYAPSKVRSSQAETSTVSSAVVEDVSVSAKISSVETSVNDSSTVTQANSLDGVGTVTTSQSADAIVNTAVGITSYGNGQVNTLGFSSPAVSSTQTIEASSLIDVIGVPSSAEFDTDTSIATTETSGGLVQSANAQGLQINPEAASGAVVVSDGMLALPKRAFNSSAETFGVGFKSSFLVTPLNSGFSEAEPVVESVSVNTESFVGSVDARVLSGRRTNFSVKTVEAVGNTELTAGQAGSSNTTPSVANVGTDSTALSNVTTALGVSNSSSPKTSVVGGGSVSETLASVFGSSNTSALSGGVVSADSLTFSGNSKTETTAQKYRVEVETDSLTASCDTSSVGGYVELSSSKTVNSQEVAETFSVGSKPVSNAFAKLSSGISSVKGYSSIALASLNTSISDGVSETFSVGNTQTSQTISVEARTKLTVSSSISQSETQTLQASVLTESDGGGVGEISSTTVGDSKTTSHSQSPPTPASAYPGEGGGKTVATDGGSIVAEAGTTESSGLSESSGGGITTAVTPESPSVGVTAATSKNTQTVSAASNFGADATTATVSISSTDSILSSPRVPFGSEASVTAKAETSSLVSLGKYIDPLTGSKAEVESVGVSAIVFPASIFTVTGGDGLTESVSVSGVDSPAFTQTDGQGFTSAITWTLKSPATSASSGAGETQTISSVSFKGEAYTKSSGGYPVTLLSEILEGEGPTIDTPGLIPRVTTDTNIERYSRRVSVARSRTSTSFGKQTSVVIDDVTTDFNHYE